MTQEDIELLLIDLCMRLPYGVKCQWDTYYEGILTDVCKCKTKDGFIYWDCYFEECGDDVPIEIVRPYLRPMRSMTEEEFIDFMGIRGKNLRFCEIQEMMSEYLSYPNIITVVNTLDRYSRNIDWLNKNMFDYRGLIEKGFAITVTNEDNPYK